VLVPCVDCEVTQYVNSRFSQNCEKRLLTLPYLHVCINSIKALQFLPPPCTAHLQTGWYAAMTLTVTKDEHLNHNCSFNCSFSKAWNSSLMMVPAWTETCRSNCRNFNCFNISLILYLCASSWKNKKCFAISVCSSAWNNSARSRQIIVKFDIWVFFENLAIKIQAPLLSDKNNGRFTWRPMYVYDYISLNSF
jgi:hypothetical protein